MASLPPMDRMSRQMPPTSSPMVHDPCSPVYTDDNFMMFCFKVLPCEKTYRHDWWACPFVHPGESAKRRDPRKFKYSAVACPNAKQGGHCPRGDKCPGTHSVFEYWLHPSRFRTQFCDRGIHCNQPFCFFAHTVEQLRMPSAADISESSQSPMAQEDNSSTATSFDHSLSMRTMSFDRSIKSSFDGTSPRMPPLSDIHNSLLKVKQPAPPLRRYPDVVSYDCSSARAPVHLPELHSQMAPTLVTKERKSIGHRHSFQGQHRNSIVSGAGSMHAGATPRSENHVRSVSLAQDINMLQDLLDQMYVTPRGQGKVSGPAVRHVNPPVWTPSYNNLGSPNSPLLTQGSDPFAIHDPKLGSSAIELEGALSQLGLGLGNPLGLRG